MLENIKKRKDKLKWVITILIFMVVFTAYFGRVNISLALPFIIKDYSWTQFQKGNLGGILLGVFLVSYGLSNIFLSSLVYIIGFKNSLIIAILIWTISTFFGAILGNVYNLLLISRIFVGLGQGILIPIASKMVQNLFVSKERSRGNAYYLSGAGFANILAPLILVPLVVMFHSWRVMFYLVALIGIILILPIWFYLKDLTICFPDIQDINEEIGEMKTFESLKKELKKVIKGRNFLILVVSHSFMCIALWGMLLWLPTYLTEIHKFNFNLEGMALGLTIPSIGGIIGLFVGSWIGDKTGKRIITIVMAFLATALLFLTISLFHSRLEIILNLSLIMFFRAMIAPNIFALLQSIVPSGTIIISTGLLNGIGHICGLIGPVMIGISIALSGSYKLGFAFIAIVLFLGGSLLIVFYKEKEQDI